MNLKGKHVDRTYLRFDSGDFMTKRGCIHRDYLAHCLRWSHVAKALYQGRRYQTAHVLDVGCGQETPLARLMFSMRMTHTTGSYTGVDIGKIQQPPLIHEATAKFRHTLLPLTDIVEAELPRTEYDVVVSFEMLEHVEPLHTFRALQRMRALCSAQAVAYVSTPCYDTRVGPADNHVNEMSREGLGALLRAAGFEVTNVWGTFASQRDYKKPIAELYPGIEAILERLGEYYDSNVLACLVAPLVPGHARNCLWQLAPGDERLAPDAALIDTCHSSSTLWPTHLKQIIKEVKHG